jgi:PAS domain S-box-containing protein
MDTSPRNTGIAPIGQMSWGTHGCLFYETQQDLLDVLIPYFRAGLENHEFCLYVAAEPMNANAALQSLPAAIPNFERYRAEGQFEIVPFTEWLFSGGRFDFQKALKGFREKRDQALARGYAGLRFVGNPYPVAREHWDGFVEFERAVDELMSDSQIIGVCTYALNRSSADDVLDIVGEHALVLARRNGNWEELAGAALRRAHEEIRQLNAGLERRVAERTALLAATNAEMSREVDEHRRAEDQLRLQAQVVATVPDAIIATNGQMVITSWNPGAEALYGWQADEVIGRSATDLFQSEFDGVTRAAVLQAAFQNSGYRGEMRQQRKDGSWIAIESHVSVVRDADGQTVSLVAVNHDISKRKQMEERLRASQARTESVLASVADSHIVIGWDWRYLYVNEAAARGIRRPREQILGCTLWELYPDIAGTEIDRQYHLAMEQRIPVAFEFHYDTQDTWWDNRFYPVPEGLAVFSTDITARKKAEAEIGRSAARAAALARSAAELNAQLNLSAVLKTICAETAQGLEVPVAIVQLYDDDRGVFEYGASTGLPPGAGERVAPLARAVYEAVFRPPADGALTIWPDLRDVPGLPNAALFTEFDLRTSVTAALRREGRLLGLLRIATIGVTREFGEEELALLEGLADLAALAIANAQLFQEVSAGRGRLKVLSHRLLEVQEAERRLIARQLHDEIGQSLTAVKINLQALQRTLSRSASSQVDESIGVVEATLERVRSLSVELRPSVLDDLGLAAALRWYVDRQAQRAGLQAHVTADLPEGRLPPEVETASFRLAQEALTNVVRHARAARVEVNLRRDRDALELVIRDDGVGFDVPAAQAQVVRGGSLGLLSMQERVLLAGGEIKIESTPNQGSRVWARFPLERQAPAQQGGAARHSA